MLAGLESLHQPRRRIGTEHREIIRQPRSVREQMMHRHQPELGHNRQSRQILEHRLLHVELAFIAELQQNQRDKRLGNRPNLEQMIGRHRLLQIHIGVAKPRRPQRLLRVRQAQRQPRRVHRLHIRDDIRVEPVIERP